MKINVSIQDKKDPNADKIFKELKKLNGSYVTVGIHQDAGQYPDGQDVVQVALCNEFGTDTIPERSFFRSAIDGNQSKINAWQEEALERVLSGQWTAEHALESIGFKIQILIQNKIQSNVPPPNAPSTVRKKMNSGTLPKSIRIFDKNIGQFKKGSKYNSKTGEYGVFKRLTGEVAANYLSASGHTKTLIDTGLMLRSVTYKVIMK